MSKRGGKTQKGVPLELKVLVALAVALTILALIGPYVVVHDPYATRTELAYRGPSLEYPLGTDNMGRCVLCRIIVGLQTSLVSSLVVVVCSFVLGTLLGISAGYFGGLLDRIIIWLVTSFQVFPSFLLAIVIAGFLGPGFMNACIALVVVYWTTYARMARSLVFALKEHTFVKASALSGCGAVKTIVRHIMPNIATYMLIIATGDIGGVILSMSGLSYLGLGMQRPTADWGVMLSEAKGQIFVAPQLMLYVGMCLSLVVLLFNLLGDRFRDYFDTHGEVSDIGPVAVWWRRFRRSRWGLLKGDETAIVPKNETAKTDADDSG
jgi:peptide/nickel transport system permease protein/nickel transport system permease protein